MPSAEAENAKGLAAMSAMDHATLIVHDMRAMILFYHEVLALKPTGRPEYGYCELDNPALVMAFFQDETWADAFGISPPASGAGRVLLQFSAEDVDAAVERASQYGGAVLAAPRETPWGTRSGLVQDPDGNMLEIYRWT